MEVSKSKIDSIRLKTFVYDFFKTKEFLRVKTPMGIIVIKMMIMIIKG